jgi:RNA polymerase sigma factor (TIGR02999 family)
MRNILVDQARRKAAVKHGGEMSRAQADPSDVPIQAPTQDVIALDAVLTRLENEDLRKAQIVQLRYFAGFTLEETAAALGISTDTVKREWRYLKAWLFSQLGEDASAVG